MARIAGVDLPRDKRIEIGLTYIYGIGRPSADKIFAQANVNPDTLRFLYDSCACLMPFTQTRLRLKQCVRWHQLAQII